MEYFVLLVRFVSHMPVGNLMLLYEIILPSKLFEICEEGLITLPLKNTHSFKKILQFACGLIVLYVCGLIVLLL